MEKIGLEAILEMGAFTKGMKQYTGGIDEMTDKTEKGSSVFSKIGSVLGGIAKVGIAAAITGFGALTAVIVDSIGEAANAQAVDAQLDAVLKATGGTAGMTKDEILGLADALSRVTPFEDDMIAATETVLLQFRAIGKDVFPQATEMALDLATRLGIDTTSAAKLLGKALEDPTAGLGRLRQAGVNFTDAQQAMVDKMVASGDIAGAQKFIMDELALSIGGAAQAAGDTFAGKMTILQNSLGNVKEAIGTAFLPVLTQLADKFTAFVQENGPQIEAFFQSVADWVTNRLVPGLIEIYNWIATYIPPAIQTLAEFWTNILQPALAAIWDFISVNVIPILVEVYNWLATNLPPAIQALSDLWTNTLQPALQAVWDFIQNNVIPIFQTVAGWFTSEGPSAIGNFTASVQNVLLPIITFMQEQFAWIIDWIAENWPLIQETVEKVMTAVREIIDTVLAVIRRLVDTALTAIRKFWEEHGQAIMTVAKNAWEIIKTTIETVTKVIFGIIKAVMQLITGDWEGAWNTIKGVTDTLMNGIKDVIAHALEIIKTIWNEATTAIKTLWENALNAIKDVLDKVINTIKQGLIGAFSQIQSWIGGLVSSFSWLTDWIGAVRDAFQWIIEAIQRVINWIRQLIEWLQELGNQVPTWLQGGSPPPLANWLGDIGKAVEELAKAQLPELQAQLNMGLGGMTLPRQAMTPAMAGAGQNVNVSFGDTTINSGLDAASFQAQVLQTVTRAVRGY